MLTEDRLKQLMLDVGMPQSLSLAAALRQANMEGHLYGREEERARIRALVQGLLGEWITKYNRQVGVASAYDSAGVAYDDGRINALRQVLSILEEDAPHE